MKKKLLRLIARNDREIENLLKHGQTTWASVAKDANNSLRRIVGAKPKRIQDFKNW